MARAVERLTAQRVERLKNAEEPRPGMYADGAGLYLRVTSDGAKNWVLRYMLDRRPRWMGLGPLSLYGLADARTRALDARRKRHDGIDPIEARRAERARQRLDAAKAITFKQCAEATSTPTAPDGAMKSTSINGRRRFPPTPIRSSGRCRCRRWTPALCSRCWNRSGRRSLRRPAGSASAWKTFWTLPRCAAIATAKTRPGGAAISTSCCRPVQGSARSSTSPPCPMPSCRPFWRACARERRSQPADLSF